uniref:Uncharacterized protein n=1 Tax=Fagus sylvatica TaxID=28930 RepID=A0A2N9HFD6_FAGSY
MLCSALSSRIFCSSSPRSVLMKPPLPICPHEAMDLSPPEFSAPPLPDLSS